MTRENLDGIDYASRLVSPLAARVADDNRMEAEARSEMANMSDRLKQFIDESGLTTYALSKQSGVNIDSLYRFRAGERDLTFQAASKVAEALGLELIRRDPGKATEGPAVARKPSTAAPAKKKAKKVGKRFPPK